MKKERQQIINTNTQQCKFVQSPLFTLFRHKSDIELLFSNIYNT